MRADGIVGGRLQWYMLDPLPDIAGETFRRFWRRLRDLGMHLHLNIEGSRMPAVARELSTTGVTLVIDHYRWHDPAPRSRPAGRIYPGAPRPVRPGRAVRGQRFQLHDGYDRAGFLMTYHRRAAGYYIDVGASDLISSGNLMQARFHSLHLALQIKARMERLNVQVYSRPA
jgi:hypothetical protein